MDQEILEAALIGLRFKQSEIDARITELRGQIAGGARKASAAPAAEPKRTRGPFRPAAKRRIALAQKRRWAAYRAAKAAALAEAAKSTASSKTAVKAAAKKTAARKASKVSRPAVKKTAEVASAPPETRTAAAGE
ncbi:MAG TPA: hypothetical protein VG672_23135 [Bryobacteraceae bacterium]|nr:hypothetical protein [Bryobacteraceae bacterium]